MSTFAPTATLRIVDVFASRAAAASSPSRRQDVPAHDDREAMHREAERLARQRAQAERARDNAAARHPLALR
ncbi:hypothetical protein [Promicromonospora soli]|uniref:Uncharacterized protein n=1 Tax=Promicromonospora soli TaxID=2035533 RepID=A0A919G0R9_9MICO|nr:hypothetical protein [Promicromonospora soli]GHH75998.1 hypothetical protein GCM10017772_33350 [Promicromonospora soli]